MFVVNGGSYALTAPLFGLFCDRVGRPALVNAVGAFLIVISFTFLGPAPFVSLPTLLPVCVGALVVHGFGIGAMLVSSFAAAHR